MSKRLTQNEELILQKEKLIRKRQRKQYKTKAKTSLTIKLRPEEFLQKRIVSQDQNNKHYAEKQTCFII